jgi:hypothetical protein
MGTFRPDLYVKISFLPIWNLTFIF